MNFKSLFSVSLAGATLLAAHSSAIALADEGVKFVPVDEDAETRVRAFDANLALDAGGGGEEDWDAAVYEELATVDARTLKKSAPKRGGAPRGGRPAPRGGQSSTYGNTTFYSKGGQSSTYGNTSFYSRGGQSSTYGNTTFYSQGGQSSTYGNTTFFSNGGQSSTYGNTTFFSNGGQCSTYGNSSFCS